ncbi:MAG: DUF1653 domain-containing protein [Sphaerochaeta sp.]|uniref:DUF1653 domain-containing protein n=1 Tax=Sphaerochaeta sp. TaxID=1972642 RepID=UPI001DD5B927|nr:DUF1653 domain-containing protein [uncultured Sphaerochaeta sp.]MDD3929225.1 DUF1653 domain-containing protein [Sphaerochaeta sp.]NCC13208.1 DUF1653 domain-containing protein [Spirochaetia bacterium]NCC88853.1 DUF1653 domain-containing protein [Spirochaetia bacterium]
MVTAQNIKAGLYRHFKGGLYEVLECVINSESLESMVLYRPVGSPTLWVRPYSMFFEEVERDGKSIPRFQFVSEQIQ